MLLLCVITDLNDKEFAHENGCMLHAITKERKWRKPMLSSTSIRPNYNISNLIKCIFKSLGENSVNVQDVQWKMQFTSHHAFLSSTSYILDGQEHQLNLMKIMRVQGYNQVYYVPSKCSKLKIILHPFFLAI